MKLGLATLKPVGLILIVLSGMSCGEKKDLGADVAMRVIPSQPLIVPGSGSNCLDKSLAATTGDPVGKSVDPFRVLFTSFALRWESGDTLYPTAIEVTIEHPQLEDGAFVYVITDDELNALLGTLDGKLGPGASLDSSVEDGRPQTLPPCGLHVGGVKLASENPPPFTAKVTVKFKAYAVVTAEGPRKGEQYRVEKIIEAKAEY